MLSWDWNPGVSVGELVFGATLRPDDFDCPIELLPPSSDDASWQTYRIGDELGRVSVVDGQIASVECVASLRNALARQVDGEWLCRDLDSEEEYDFFEPFPDLMSW